MKKKLIITESQYKRLINEQEDYTEQLLSLINSNDETNLEMVKEIAPGQGIDLVQFLSDNIDKIDPPYFYKFNLLRLNKNKQIEVFKNIFGDDITMFNKLSVLFDSNNKILYFEENGYWYKREYDINGDEIYFENSNGYWEKFEYDSNGTLIYVENSEKGIKMDRR